MKVPLDKMNRRDAIQKASKIMGTAISAPLVIGVLAGCEADVTLDWSPQVLTTRQAAIVADLAEQILPETDTPGAKEARVERFIDSMVAGYLPEAERTIFLEGLALLAKEKFDKKAPDEQFETVRKLAESARRQGKDENPKSFFLLAKEMTLLGFFTSEIGATQVLNYDPIPGGYKGCASLEDVGGKTWAT